MAARICPAVPADCAGAGFHDHPGSMPTVNLIAAHQLFGIQQGLLQPPKRRSLIFETVDFSRNHRRQHIGRSIPAKRTELVLQMLLGLAGDVADLLLGLKGADELSGYRHVAIIHEALCTEQRHPNPEVGELDPDPTKNCDRSTGLGQPMTLLNGAGSERLRDCEGHRMPPSEPESVTTTSSARKAANSMPLIRVVGTLLQQPVR